MKTVIVGDSIINEEKLADSGKVNIWFNKKVQKEQFNNRLPVKETWIWWNNRIVKLLLIKIVHTVFKFILYLFIKINFTDINRVNMLKWVKYENKILCNPKINTSYTYKV